MNGSEKMLAAASAVIMALSGLVYANAIEQLKEIRHTQIEVVQRLSRIEAHLPNGGRLTFEPVLFPDM